VEKPETDQSENIHQMPFLETTGVVELGLQAPFMESIKPHTYAKEPTHSLAEEAMLETGQLSSGSLSADLSALPLLHVERSDMDEGHEQGSALSSFVSEEEKKPDLSAISLLGEGGMGKVLLAEQRSLNREVAIKSVKSHDPSLVSTQALLHEGKMMGALSHPNVLPVYALGHDKHHQPVLVMKHVEGVSWLELLQRPEHPLWLDSPYSREEQLIRHLEIFMDVCNAVAFAHEKGILHRDIKPENVMIGAFGEVLLLDWGLAIRLQDGQAHTTKLVGTPSYMAPEMVSGTLSIETDIYLLGATLHHVLMGHPRHEGDSIYKVIFSVAESAPYAYPPHIPEELAALCHKAMHAEQEHRFHSASALKEAIAAYLRHRGSYQLADVGEERLLALNELIERKSQHDGDAQDEGHGARLGAQIEAVFSECQFAFMQALQQWPDNQRATQGIQRCLELMCRYEIRVKQLEGAEAHFNRLLAPPDELAVQLQALQHELQAERQEQEALLQLKDELDFNQKPLPRFLLLVGMAVLVVFSLIVSVMQGNAVFDLSYEEALSLDVMLLVAYGGFLVWKRKLLLARRIDRRFFLFIGICFLSGFFHHWHSWYVGLPLKHANIAESVTFVMLSVYAGMTIRSWFYIGAVASSAAALMMIFLPQFHAAVYTINGMFLLFFLVFLLYTQLNLDTQEEARSTAS
jgi:serine/threonine-protein kinase